ncbi:MAG: NUDIX domain-containing protein [Bacteroidales bacterium]|nr:NUDIX domain-containing protein [Bacteroidales bacterium]
MHIIISYQYWRMTLIFDNMQSSDTVQANDGDIKKCFDSLVDGKHDMNVVLHGDPRRLLQYCKSNFIMVKAAGGVVTDPATGKRLLIYRNGHWDLPKGKVEEGETLAQAALREVVEETDIKPQSVNDLICKCYHIYNLYGGWHFKQTSWFNMDCPGGSVNACGHPQTEEGIEQVAWVDPQEWHRRLNDSYGMLRTVSERIKQQ